MTSSTERARRHRERRRNDIIVVPAEIYEVDTVSMLADLGLLDESQELTKAEVGYALSQWIYKKVQEYTAELARKSR
jgi:hypothetical protein